MPIYATYIVQTREKCLILIKYTQFITVEQNINIPSRRLGYSFHCEEKRKKKKKKRKKKKDEHRNRTIK